MARVSADTLKTTANAKPDAAEPKRGRRATNGNPAQARRPESAEAAEPEDAEIVDEGAVDAETPVASSKQLELDAEAATDEIPAPAPTPRRGVTQRTAIPAGAARAALPMAQQAAAGQVSAADVRQIQDDLLGEDRDLLALGKLTRFALENGLTVEDCVERFRTMVSAYDRTRGA